MRPLSKSDFGIRQSPTESIIGVLSDSHWIPIGFHLTPTIGICPTEFRQGSIILRRNPIGVHQSPRDRKDYYTVGLVWSDFDGLWLDSDGLQSDSDGLKRTPIGLWSDPESGRTFGYL